MESTCEDSNALLVPDSQLIKTVRTALETQGLYNNACRITKLQDGSIALPLSQDGVEYFCELIYNQNLFPQTFAGCSLARAQFPPSKKAIARSHSERELLYQAMEEYLSQFSNLNSSEKDQLLLGLPSSWERHGDLVILPNTAFTDKMWSQLSHQTIDTVPVDATARTIPVRSSQYVILWKTVASALKCKRLAIDTRIKCDKYRSSGATVVLGEDGWVEHIDNGIKYLFDVTKVMFSSGNITEKIRVAGFKCEGETVLDLYAGIGYFTLPYLVHAGAELVHACEWNLDAVEALERGLVANRVKEKCVVHYGDNRKLNLKNFADRVNLGLIPSSAEGWPVACAALKSLTGGWLHIHGNVSSKDGESWRKHGAESNPWTKMEEKQDTRVLCSDGVPQVCKSDKHLSTDKSKKEKWKEWSHYVTERVMFLLNRENPLEKEKQWRVTVRELVHVKSYAPHVDHLVADIECRPVSCRP